MGSEFASQREQPASVPSRRAVGIRALVLLALAMFFPTALVRNWSDNAYLLLPLTGVALLFLSLPFMLAAALPDGAGRRVAAWVGVVLVWSIGGLCCLLLALALIPAATQYATAAVFISHLIGLALLVPVAIGIRWRLHDA
jgi:hypothetical protein